MHNCEPSSRPGWWGRLQRLFFAPDGARALLAAPRAQTLENIAGGEQNLLGKEQTRQDLRIEFDLWAFSEPTPSDPEILELYLTQYGDVAVASQQWTAPITPQQCFILLPQRYLVEGVHELWYRVTQTATGTSERSETFSFTVDLSAPELGADRGKLVFPAEALQGVTARYLETHGDRLQAQLPAYYPMRPGDRLTVYWEQQPVGSLVLYERTLSQEEASQPLVLVFTGEQIRSHGDGMRYATYEVEDRAGNQSRLSQAVGLQVAAAPVPRNWPAPTVRDSSGGQVYGLLNPLQALDGVTVMVPAAAVFYADEVAQVQWGAVGDVGATLAPAYIEGAGPWPGRIGKQFIAAHMGKRLTVSYRLEGDDSLAPSQTLSLQVGMLGNLPTVASAAGMAGNGRLSLAAVPAGGDPLTLAPWPLITAATQRIKLWAEGTAGTGVKATHVVLDDVAINSAQVNRGIIETLPRLWLETLRLQSPLSLYVEVSFDAGQHWHAFPSVHMTLVA